MIKNILFDLDDTILDFHRAEKIAVADTLLHFGLEPTNEILDRYHVINMEHWKMLEKGLLNREQVKVLRYEALFNELGVQANAAETAKYYEKRLAIGHFFVDGAEEMLKTLSEKYNLYLVSNGTAPVQKGRIESAGISKYFKSIYISENIGFNKPSLEFFEYCFNDIINNAQEENNHILRDAAEESSICKDEFVIIGDSLSSDILGGINAGIRTVWFNPNGMNNDTDVIPDYEVSSLFEIVDLIKRI